MTFERIIPQLELIPGLRTQIVNFLHPQMRFNAHNQLLTMAAFWEERGVEVPELSEETQHVLARAARDHPTTHRIIPTPLRFSERRKDDLAVEAADGTVWIFPLLDVRTSGEPADADLIPESLAAIQSLRERAELTG